MNLIRALLIPSVAMVVAGPLRASPPAGDPVPVARRLVATAQLAAQEYRVGVPGRSVVAPKEVEEARLFLTEARRSAALLPAPHAAEATAALDRMAAMVARVAPADSLDAAVRSLGGQLAQSLHASLEEIPADAPSLARGAEVYRANCASCHGDLGRGDGPAAAALTPAPANLADGSALRDRSPLDFYRRITIGVTGTAMPAFEGRLTSDDRWAAAAYATVLRLPAPSGEVPPALAPYPVQARLSDEALAGMLGVTLGDPAALRRVSAVRNVRAEASVDQSTRVFAATRAQLDSAVLLAESGHGPDGSRMAFDAYMTFEGVERAVRAKAPATADALEASFAALRTRAQGGATASELRHLRADLAVGLEKAERAIADVPSATNLFIQSFVLLLREGLEAILIVGALMTFLVKTGAGHRKRDIHIGVGAAVAMSLLTAVLLETIFRVSPAHREALEGFTMVLATGVLFYVSYWLLSKMEVVKWTSFVKGKVNDAVTSGSALALASAAFLAVYREGFETVIFYKALFVSEGAAGSAMPVLAGIAAGSLALAAVYIGINRFGVRLPIKPFFAFTSAFLYYMAFVFAGKGVAELQEGGFVSTTLLDLPIRVPSLGVYPTAESLGLQALLVVLALAALVWNFVIVPRREAAAAGAGATVPPKAVPDAPPSVPAASAAPVEVRTPRDAPDRVAMLRALERMEGDLGALRDEVQRLRDMVLARNSPSGESVAKE